jgi:serine/threonine protein kinase
MSRDPEYVARFMREATTAGRMEHPNIVQIHDVGYA